VRKVAPGDASDGDRTRFMANAKFADVTAAPVLKRSPFRIANAYVRPSREIFGSAAAASGVGREPP
jgi:hypothetical protein